MEVSYEMLMINRGFCVDETVEYVKNLVVSSPESFNSSTRDISQVYREVLNRVVDACLDCFIHLTDEPVHIAASRYRRGNTWLPIAATQQVETDIHNFLKNIIVNYIFGNVPYPNPKSSISQILSPWEVGGKDEAEQYLNVVINGINRSVDRVYLHNHLAKRFTAKFWSTRNLESYKLDAILETAYIAPSKQGYHDFEMHVITDSPEGREFKQWLYWEDTWCFNGTRKAPGEGPRRYNGQVLAPVVVIWLAKNFDMSQKNYGGEALWFRTNNDIMVSSTMAMCQAEELGVQTGFCKTIGAREIADKLNKPDHMAVITVGFGYAESDYRAARRIYKDGVYVGFDLSNTDHTIRAYDNRNKRPEKHLMINYL